MRAISGWYCTPMLSNTGLCQLCGPTWLGDSRSKSLEILHKCTRLQSIVSSILTTFFFLLGKNTNVKMWWKNNYGDNNDKVPIEITFTSMKISLSQNSADNQLFQGSCIVLLVSICSMCKLNWKPTVCRRHPFSYTPWCLRIHWTTRKTNTSCQHTRRHVVVQ